MKILILITLLLSGNLLFAADIDTLREARASLYSKTDINTKDANTLHLSLIHI